jgi:cyclopropane-fatty-acyl-phospholipid synthase
MTVADRLAALVGGPLPVRIRAWDGSEAGPAGGPTLVIRSRRALRRLMWSPNELGLAQAYIAKEIDVDGCLADGLRRARAAGRVRVDLPRALGAVVRLGALGPRPPAPALTAELAGRPHSRDRDRAAISYHYDLSNEFYELILDPRMAYSCAYWTSVDRRYTLADAQRDKLDLICRKLGLEPGMRMLDVGCGWGALAIHAAREYGVCVTGVTLSAEQRDFVVKRVADEGLAGAVDIRLRHWRDTSDGPYDAISAVEMGEHVGEKEYPVFAGRLAGLLGPRGRLLVQQMSRGAHAPGGGAFIEAYVAPDMHMRPVGRTVALFEDAGLEVRDVHAMREHYVRTVRAWQERLEDRWAEAVAMVGEPVARIWRLYLAGGALAFEEGRMGVDQILAVRPAGDGGSGMPAVRS